jgi:membrane associated rhomboid family serine protease
MTTWITRLVIANVVMFLITMASPEVMNKLMFVPAFILLQPWTLITYMFLHANITHILFNMIGLYFFGPRLEIELGSTKFLLLYFISGICGGLLSFLFAPNTPIVGASAAVFGVFYAFARYWPKEQLYVWGLFPIQARWMVVGMTALSLFGGFTGFEQGIAHFAHLGGFVGGFFFIKWVDSSSRTAGFQKKTTLPTPSSSETQKWMKISHEGLHEVNREELDRVLNKLKTTGVESLTPDEIAFLNRFSNR